mgnify:CR=1 FL=1
MKMKKFLAVLLSAAMVLGIAGCGSSTETTETAEGEETTETAGVAASDIKVGLFLSVTKMRVTHTLITKALSR